MKIDFEKKAETVKRSLIRLKELEDRLQVSETWIWRAERAGTFPRRKKLGAGRAVAWSLAEIEAWESNLEPIQLAK